MNRVRQKSVLECSLITFLLFLTGVKSKCLVRDPSGVTSPPQHGDAGFELSINEQPEFYEERNLYTITLKVRRFLQYDITFHPSIFIEKPFTRINVLPKSIDFQ